jgi:hypothetical protein
MPSSPRADVVIADDTGATSDEAQREATLKFFSEFFGVPVEAFVSLDPGQAEYTYEPLTALPDCAYRRPVGVCDIDDGDQDTRL